MGEKTNYHLYIPICRSAQQYNMNIYYYIFLKKLSHNENLQNISLNEPIICNELLKRQIYLTPYGIWNYLVHLKFPQVLRQKVQ